MERFLGAKIIGIQGNEEPMELISKALSDGITAATLLNGVQALLVAKPELAVGLGISGLLFSVTTNIVAPMLGSDSTGLTEEYGQH